ncbi:MAG TPA: hypothetical protein PKB15_08155 [Acidimicrobiia bacterium]|nr:hypothetical protein [Acidimicrobiia bacterium]
MKDILAIVAAILAVVGYVPYLRDTITKSATPHPYTWLLWSIVSGITLSGQITKGAGIGALPTAVAELLTISIFIYSLRYGFAMIRKSDHIFLFTALLGLIPWMIFRDPTISVCIAVAIDVIAFTPTILKAWRRPESETPLMYAMNVMRHIFSLGAFRQYNVATTLHSIAMITTNTIMVLFVIRRYTKGSLWANSISTPQKNT